MPGEDLEARNTELGRRALALGWLTAAQARGLFLEANREGLSLPQAALRRGLLPPEQARQLEAPTHADASTWVTPSATYRQGAARA